MTESVDCCIKIYIYMCVLMKGIKGIYWDLGGVIGA